jgi:MFS family permease
VYTKARLAIRLRVSTQLSDRYGRRIVIFVSLFGLFVTEFTHVITAWFVDVLPGGYWFPLVGFLIEGLFGSECIA